MATHDARGGFVAVVTAARTAVGGRLLRTRPRGWEVGSGGRRRGQGRRMVAEVVIPVNVAEQDARWRFVAEGCQDTATKPGGRVAGATMLGGPLCKHRQEMS